jgi:hypothetical protein
MFILRDLLAPLQEEFSNTKQGQKRKFWFALHIAHGGGSIHFLSYQPQRSFLEIQPVILPSAWYTFTQFFPR